MAGDADRLGGHRVAASLELDEAGLIDDDGEAKCVLAGRDGERSQTAAVRGEARCRRHPHGAAGPLGIDLPQPVGELCRNIIAALKAPALEEAAPHEFDQVPDRALVLADARGAQLGNEPVVEGDLSERVVPIDSLPVPPHD